MRVSTTRPRPRGACFAIALALAWGNAGVAAAQRAEPDRVFADRRAGVTVRLPDGWTYERGDFAGPDGARGRLRGVSPDQEQAIQILLFRKAAEQHFSAWLDAFAGQLRRIEGVTEVRAATRKHAGRPAAFADALTGGAPPLHTTYFCLPIDREQVWVLAYSRRAEPSAERLAPPAPGEAIPSALGALLDSLEVTYDPLVAREVEEALERGREYLNTYQLQADMQHLRVDPGEQLYLIRVDGEPVGFLTRQFSSELAPGTSASGGTPKQGVRVRERRWRFDDGVAAYETQDLFASRDGKTDLTEVWRSTIPLKSDEPIVTTQHQAVREGDLLLSSVARNGGEPARRSLTLESHYLALAWSELLPALLGVEPRPMLAVTVYSHEEQTLVPLAILPLGSKPLPREPEESAYVFELREGFAGEPWLLFTDAYGALEYAERGETAIVRSDRESVESRFGAQRDAALERLRARGRRTP